MSQANFILVSVSFGLNLGFVLVLLGVDLGIVLFGIGLGLVFVSFGLGLERLDGFKMVLTTALFVSCFLGNE